MIVFKDKRWIAIPEKRANGSNTFLLSDLAKNLTWQQWKTLGGCGLSDGSEHSVCRQLGKLPVRKYGWQKATVEPNASLTLGQIQDTCIVAGREIARFAKDHLGKPEMAIPEYVNGELVS